MPVLDTTYINLYGGCATSIPTRIEYDQSVYLDGLLSRINIIAYTSDELIGRFIPECVDPGSSEKSFVLVDNIANNLIYAINVSDVERCYYDKMGIPDSLSGFLGSILLIEDSISNYKILRRRCNDTFPLFKSVLMENFSQIKYID